MKTRSFIALLAFVAFATVTAHAEAPPVWVDDFAKASELAKAENKSILFHFSGSDWCALDMKLEKEIFTKPKFHEYAEHHLILVKADFPHGKAQNPKIKEQNALLKKKFAVKGFPTLILLNSDGQKVWESPFLEGGPDALINAINNALKKTP
jgi:protein disulfide-isomerase